MKPRTLEQIETEIEKLKKHPVIGLSTYQGKDLRKMLKESEDELEDMEENLAVCFRCKCCFHIDNAVLEKECLGETYCSKECRDENV